MKVHTTYIGRTIACPRCAAPSVVPDPDALPVAEEVVSAPESLAAAMRDLAPAEARPPKIPTKQKPAPSRRSPAKPPARPARRTSAVSKFAIIGIAAAFVIAAALLILAFFAGDGGKKTDKPVTKEDPLILQAPPPPPPKPERNPHPPGDLFPKVAPSN
jgi:hypothetical protein